MVANFKYYAPATITELCKLLDENQPTAKILAGGTDILVDIRAGIKNPSALIDIKKIKELNELKFDKKDGLSIGAAVTCNQLINDKIAHNKYKLLADCAETIASYQLRNRATIIGNLCNASPCAGMTPGLLCLDASVEIISSAGSRIIKLLDFFAGVKKTKLQPNEFVARVIVPASSADAKAGVLKQKRIKGHDIALITVTMAIVNKKIYVAIGSAAETVVLLKPFQLNAKCESIVAEALKSVKPITDIRSSKEYRLHIIEVYIKRLYKQLLKK